MIPGFEDGDYPEWPAQEMLDWMPEEASRFGEYTNSVLNGPFLVIPPDKESAIVDALEAAGYTCERNDPLVQTASGRVTSSNKYSGNAKNEKRPPG